MKLARYRMGDGPTRIGRVDDDRITNVSGVPGVGTSLKAILPRLDSLREAIEAAEGSAVPLTSVSLLAPIDDPQKYLGIGMNYAAHAEEARQAGIPIPSTQMWFNKQVSCIVGPYDAVERPSVSEQLDYEVELAVVIGQRCRHVSKADARGVIAGYMVANDVSVRDWLAKRSPTFTLGKSFDTHGPVGPWLTTDDEIADPHDLELSLTVNGEERQRARTDDLIYDIFEQIEYLSTVMTLMPGDILATGTPAGIGAPTQRWLKPGDVVHARIDGLGSIENVIVDERTGD